MDWFGRSMGLALLVLSSAASAQTIGDGGGGGGDGGGASISAPPAEKIVTSEGGLDMRSGRYAYSETDLTLGDMTFTRQLSGGVLFHVEPFSNFGHNWDITVWSKSVDLDNGNFETGPDERVSINYGGTSSTFEKRLEHSQYDKVSKDAFAELTNSGGVFTFRSEAATIVFGQASSCAGSYPCAQASSVKLADGTTYTLTYETGAGNKTRLRRVVSNRGTALMLQYGANGAGWDQVSKACVLNLATRTDVLP